MTSAILIEAAKQKIKKLVNADKAKKGMVVGGKEDCSSLPHLPYTISIVLRITSNNFQLYSEISFDLNSDFKATSSFASIYGQNLSATEVFCSTSLR